MNRLAYVTLLSLAVLLGVRARAITAGEIDFNNTHENVAATLITVGPGHPAGVPEGTLVGQCTGTLIHPNMWRKGLQRTDLRWQDIHRIDHVSASVAPVANRRPLRDDASRSRSSRVSTTRAATETGSPSFTAMPPIAPTPQPYAQSPVLCSPTRSCSQPRRAPTNGRRRLRRRKTHDGSTKTLMVVKLGSETGSSNFPIPTPAPSRKPLLNSYLNATSPDRSPFVDSLSRPW
jgi:hypothetical protein